MEFAERLRSVAITGAVTTATLGGDVGVSGVSVTLGTTTGAGFTTGTLVTTGLTDIKLAANGTSLQTISTLTNSDNSTITITGNAALTITNALAGGTTGSKVDGSAMSGALTVTGSGVSDVIIGGAGDDNLSGGVNAVSDTLTGGAGRDTFTIISGATSATADVITDFVTKVDMIEFGGAAGTATNYTEATAAVADFAAALAAANTAFGAAGILYNVQQVGNDSYVFYTATAADGVADMAVKLTGVSLAGIEAADII